MKSALFLVTLSFSHGLAYEANIQQKPYDTLSNSALLEPESGSLIASQFSKDPYAGQDKMQLILAGQFKLMTVHMSSDNDIYGSFCEFDFSSQQEDPSLVPRFIDLHQTRHCEEHHITLPLREVSQACRDHDKADSKMRSMLPSAFIFHQPKSGSALLTNMISASQPGSRVISESSAVGNILGCNNCTHHAKVEALQHAIYLLGRTSRTAVDQYLYVKISAARTTGIRVVLEAFPDTQWVFVTRDPDVILQKIMNHKIERRNCDIKKRRNPGPHMSDFLLSMEKSIDNLETPEQVCAAFLASNMATVREELDRPESLGLLVEYAEDLLIKEGIQKVLEYLEISADWDRVEDQRKKNANGGKGEEWIGESEIYVSPEVKSANAEFAHPLDMEETS
jgi:hypothetical protein